MGIYCSVEIYRPLKPCKKDLEVVEKFSDGYKLTHKSIEYGACDANSHEFIFSTFEAAKLKYKELMEEYLHDEESEIFGIQLFGCWYN